MGSMNLPLEIYDLLERRLGRDDAMAVAKSIEASLTRCAASLGLEGRGRIARTAAPSYNGAAADNQGSLRRGTPEVTPVEIRAAVAHSAQEPTEATHSGSMPG